MNRFIKNTAALTFVFVAFLGIISCETDLENIESEVLKNELTASGEVSLDIKITPINDLGGIRSDNIDLGAYGDYWLGSYTQNGFSKSINAGFVSQLNLPVNTTLVTASEENTQNISFFLDKVVLKIPYSSTPSGGIGPNGETIFRIDSILPNNSNQTPTKLSVYRNQFFLNTLNPDDPSKQNSFKSNFEYLPENNSDREALLLSKNNFSYTPSADSVYYFFNRVDRSSGIESQETFRDSIVLDPRDSNGVLQDPTLPFLAIPLDKEKMETLFWNRFNSETETFSNNASFQDYFKGIIVLSEDENGILVPFNLNNSNAQVSFIFSEVNTSGTNIAITYKEYNFTLDGVINAIYDMSPAQQETSSDSFIIQGTDGSNAEIEILGVNLSSLPENHPFLKYIDKDKNGDGFLGLDDLKDFKDEEGNPLIIVNDASLKLLVDKNINSNLIDTPQRLHLYRDRDANGLEIPTNIADSFEASFQAFFNGMSVGGILNLNENQTIPDNYTFKLTDFISNFVNGSNENADTKLILKVFNEITDEPVLSNTSSLRLNVDDYNWNPRSVVLYNETAETSQKSQINIKFTELNK